MSTDTHKYDAQAEREARHSAFEEFSRDERRPAVLLLSALVIAVLFFAIGLVVGRWTTDGGPQPGATSGAAAKPPPAPADAAPTPQPTLTPSPAPRPSRDSERRFALLVATYESPEAAQPLMKTLRQLGYSDVRISTPREDDPQSKFSVLVGRFRRSEARRAATQLQATGDPRLKHARVIEDSAN